jgi:hypothetical protein
VHHGDEIVVAVEKLTDLLQQRIEPHPLAPELQVGKAELLSPQLPHLAGIR